MSERLKDRVKGDLSEYMPYIKYHSFVLARPATDQDGVQGYEVIFPQDNRFMEKDNFLHMAFPVTPDVLKLIARYARDRFASIDT